MSLTEVITSHFENRRHNLLPCTSHKLRNWGLCLEPHLDHVCMPIEISSSQQIALTCRMSEAGPLLTSFQAYDTDCCERWIPAWFSCGVLQMNLPNSCPAILMAALEAVSSSTSSLLTSEIRSSCFPHPLHEQEDDAWSTCRFCAEASSNKTCNKLPPRQT